MSDTYATKAKLFFSILALGTLILIAYANTLFSPFNFDDQALLSHINQQLLQLLACPIPACYLLQF